MSDPQSPPPYGNAPDYYSNAAAPSSSKMAMVAMILGILAVPTAIVGVGLLFGIVALILGIVSLTAINKSMGQMGGRGFAISGIVTGGVSIAIAPVVLLLVAIMMPSLGKARELSNRSVCAANLRGTTQSMMVYAADNGDAFPIVSPTGGYSLAAGGSGMPSPNPDMTINSMYVGPASPSVTQNMWLLVLTGQVAPKQFVCKSDPATMANAKATNAGGAYFTNFNDGTGSSDLSYSYSFAYMWSPVAPPKPAGPPAGAGGRGARGPAPAALPGPAKPIGTWWKDQTDASLPLIADMAPLNGSGSPAATPATPTNRYANSFNHQRDGQNVGYGDSHVEFARRPDIGQSNDNIYTANGGTPGAGGTAPMGTEPTIGTGGSAGAYDVCMVPAADGSSHARK